MRARSWMAALALIGATSILFGRGFSAQATGRVEEPSVSQEANQAQEQPAAKATTPKEEPKSESLPEKSQRSGSQLPTIQLKLAIAGLSAQGCDVEVKPANRSCKFRPSPSMHVSSGGYATIELRDVELRSADKTCSVAITVREQGQSPQTIYRGFRVGSSKSGTVPTFTCFISSRLAGVETKTPRK
jgi:hypothetical protein